MICVNEPECEAAGVDPESVKKLAALLEKAGKMSRQTSIQIFCGVGGAYLYSLDGLLLYYIQNGIWGTGDGECLPDAEGLMRRSES